jgi:undecaprenyl-phosphate 4-deoxy-4-formamido-L-arabinose transferase
MKVEISVVIPVYRAQWSIEEVVQRSLAVWKNTSVEVILVDDASDEETVAKVKALAQQYPEVRVLLHERNLGQQRSLKDGMAMAKGDYIFTLDDDLQQDPEDMPKLLNKLKEGHHVVYGLPFRDGYPVHRAIGSKMVDGVFTWVLGKPKDVKVGSFRVMERWLSQKVVADPRDFVYITAILLDHTKKLANVPVSYRERPYGQTNYNWIKLTRLFIRLFLVYGWHRK